MRIENLNGRAVLVGLLPILLMLHALANESTFKTPQPQQSSLDLFLGSPLSDPAGGSFGDPLEPGGMNVGSDWVTDEDGLNLNSNLQAENTVSPLVADAFIACHSRSKLRRSRLGTRDETAERCKSPYSTTTTTTTPEAQQEAPSPDKQQEGRPWPKLTDSTDQTELWLQLFTARGVEGVANLKVCNSYGSTPICYPYKVPGVRPLVSPATIVEPCRFCQWNSLSLFLSLPYLAPDTEPRV